jgi:glycosyltransferase involved in cell wall biosynthesis
MRIGLWHGYLLGGTGSNIFSNNLLREYARSGIDTILFAQEQQPQDYDFISQGYIARDSAQSLEESFSRPTPYPGKCVMIRPFINSALPVYVEDIYPGGLIASAYTKLDQASIAEYINFNVRAITEARQLFPFKKLLVNHALSGPEIARQALADQTPYSVILHGSDLTYAASQNETLRQLTLQGCSKAEFIFAAGESLVAQFTEISQNTLPNKIRIVTPGVDTELFCPSRQPSLDANDLASLREWAAHNATGISSEAKAIASAAAERDISTSLAVWTDALEKHSNRSADADLVNSVQKCFSGEVAPALFVGKLIAEKGPHLFLLALPLTVNQGLAVPGMIIGFGEDRPLLHSLACALQQGSATMISQLLTEIEAPLEEKPGTDFWNSLSGPNQATYLSAAQEYFQNHPIQFTGLLPHAPLARLMPYASSVTIPSLIRESFGMIAIEVLACGTLPIVTDMAGLGEIAAEADAEAIPCVKLNIGPKMVEQVANGISAAISTKKEQPFPADRAWHYADTKYSWKAVARHYLDPDSKN